MTPLPSASAPSDPQVARDNQPRWDALSKAGVLYARPFLELDEAQCRTFLDSDGLLDNPVDRAVLVLAGGGGQQGACFAWLGARVTVLDLSTEQLRREQEAAAVHGYAIRLEHGDMRDLSRFPARTFDIVYHPHSINFVPDVGEVFREVARVLRPGGQYRVDMHNPFTQLVPEDRFEAGFGYGLLHLYRDQEVDLKAVFGTDQWVVDRKNGEQVSVDHPRSWVHTFGTVTRALYRSGFVLECLSEELPAVRDPAPGSWDHYMGVVCPYLRFWTRLTRAAL